MPGDRGRWMPGIAVVAVAVMIAVLLIARPTHDAVLPPGSSPHLIVAQPAPAASPAFVMPSAVAPARLAPHGGAARGTRVALAPRPRFALREAYTLGRPLARTAAAREPAQSP
jgi:hypothetical protein